MLCTYCGEFADTHDHVVPVSYVRIHRKLEVGNKEAIPACKECNCTLSNKLYITISERARYLQTRYKTKYKNVLNFPNWDIDELDEMSADFKQSILASMNMREITKDRMKHLRDTIAADYTIQEAKMKFINMTYKPITVVVFRKYKDCGMFEKELLSEHQVFSDQIGSPMFENSAIEKAIQYLEDRGVVTVDYEIEVVRSGSVN